MENKDDILDYVEPEVSSPEESQTLSPQNSRERQSQTPEEELLQKFYAATSCEADPEAALLGRVNGELMKTLFRIGKMTERMDEEGPSDVNQLTAIMQGDEMKLCLGRQIGRFVQLRLILNSTPKTVTRLGSP